LRRLIGTKSGPGNLPLNFNSLGAVFFLADREAEIKMLAPPEKWQILADLRLEGHIFTSRLEGAADLTTDGFFKGLEQAEKAVQLVREDKFVVDVVDREELHVPPPAPYKMAELLHDAFVLCGAQPRETLDALSKFFNGVELSGTTTGLISSFYELKNTSGNDWQSDLRKQVASMHGEDSLGDGLAESVSSSGMIYPLHPELSGSDLPDSLSAKEKGIYDLLRNRALASQMQPATGENIRVEIAAGPESLFISKFHNVTERGFLDIYQGGIDKKFTEPCPLPAITTGNEATMLRIIPEKAANIPATYTVDNLFADLEEFSIAVEPVNILMLQRMIDARYVKVSQDGYWRPDDKNVQVEMILKRAFPRMQGIHLSAYIEQTISEVTSGRKGLDFALKQFDQTLMGHGTSLVKAKVKVSAQLRQRKRSSTSIIKQQDEDIASSTASTSTAVSDSTETVQEAIAPETVTPPPDSQTQELKTDSEVSSQGYLDDSATVSATSEAETPEISAEQAKEAELTEAEPSDEEIAETVELSAEGDAESTRETGTDTWSGELQKVFDQTMDATARDSKQLPEANINTCEEIIDTDENKQCQVCGKPMLLKKDHFGKFWSCSAFPKCRHSEAYSDKDVLNILCPLCGDGKIIEKRMPTGKTMYVCPENDCEFMAWARPYNIPCQVCDSTYLVEKKSLNGAIDLRCPRAGCNYKLPLPGSGNNQATAEAPKKKKKVRVRRVPKGSASGKKVRVVRRKK
jgi:DNA topoisomerase IA/ssDNA-binding Zn-finger/Zn-ribbon topoisomerase 1